MNKRFWSWGCLVTLCILIGLGLTRVPVTPGDEGIPQVATAFSPLSAGEGFHEAEAVSTLEHKRLLPPGDAEQDVPTLLPDTPPVSTATTLAMAPDRVTLMAFLDNAPPNARAGQDRYALVGAPVLLDGRASHDFKQASLGYVWSFASLPSRSALTNAAITGRTTTQAKFIPDVSGPYVVSVRVSDGTLRATDNVRIIALPPNVPPKARAGADRVTRGGQEITLDGTRSVDPDAGPTALTYAWSLVFRPPGSALQSRDILDTTTPQPRLTPDVTGAYILRLTVKDGARTSGDNVLIAVDATPPTVQIVSPQPNATILIKTPALAVTFSDVGTVVDPASLRFQANTHNLPVQCTFEETGATCVPTAPLPEGPVTLSATIADRVGNTSSPATVPVTIFTIPIANAGADRIVIVSTTITLDGRGSRAPGSGTLQYRWTLVAPSGSTTTLANPTAPNIDRFYSQTSASWHPGDYCWESLRAHSWAWCPASHHKQTGWWHHGSAGHAF